MDGHCRQQSAESRSPVVVGVVAHVGAGDGGGCTIHWTYNATELRVSIQATGSNQDKPLGSHSVLSLSGRIIQTHTRFSLRLTVSHLSKRPSVSFSVSADLPGWRIVQRNGSKRSEFGDFLVLLSLWSLWKHILPSVPHPSTHICFSFTSWV